MRRALHLAVSDDAPRGVNPRVGCVLVKDSRVIGEGHHRGAGTAHAEGDALGACSESPIGATAVVSLEPCAHVGRTGPCADALIHAGVDRVVFAEHDPTSQASGGQARLAAAGIEVIAGVLSDEAAAVNADWSFMKLHGRPYVTLKMAGSLDGRVDSTGAERLTLTGPLAQGVVQHLRAHVDAIAVGSGTVAADDPRLNVRGIEVSSQPVRVILGTAELPEGARVEQGNGVVIRITERDPLRALSELADMGIQRLLLEGGPTIASAYLGAGVVDEVRWFIAPILLGEGIAALQGLNSHVALDVTDIEMLGEDVLIVGTPVPRGA